MSKNIRILIVDDHPVVRQGLHGMLSQKAGLEVVGEAEDGFKAVEQARLLKPDIILLDLVMPGKDGIETIGDLKQDNPEVRILILTSFAEDDKVFPAIKAGAQGYMLKDSSPKLLLQAIHDVYEGKSSLHPTIAHKLVQEMSQPSALSPTRDPLTEREMQVLRLVAQGWSNPKIAQELSISESTTRVHVSNILSKLHLANRVEAALYAVQEGLTD